MLVGAVYVPALGELFAAGRGAGATLQRRADPLPASAIDLALALVATGFGYDAEQRRAAGRRSSPS